jgi:hypothetical protein
MIKKIIIILAVAVVSVLAGHATSMAELVITAPEDGSYVLWRATIEGKVVDSVNDKVWVVIHPTEGSQYWVQPRLSVKKDGAWRVRVHFGESGLRHTGLRFEVRAIANPKIELKEGDRFGFWPEALEKSQVIEVIRK